MTRTLLFLLLQSSCFLLHAGGKTYYVFAFPGSKTTAVSLEKKADFVTMSLRIQSDHKDPTIRFAEIKEAQELIRTAAESQEGLLVHKGPISLSPKPTSKFSSLSSSSYSRASTAQLHIMVQLDEQTDVYACASRIRRFLDSIKMPGKATSSLGSIQLAVADPEQYREALLTRIAKDVTFVRSTVEAMGSVSLTGLEQPVLVRQVDDRNVELFINYSMTVETTAP